MPVFGGLRQEHVRCETGERTTDQESSRTPAIKEWPDLDSKEKGQEDQDGCNPAYIAHTVVDELMGADVVLDRSNYALSMTSKSHNRTTTHLQSGSQRMETTSKPSLEDTTRPSRRPLETPN